MPIRYDSNAVRPLTGVVTRNNSSPDFNVVVLTSLAIELSSARVLFIRSFATFKRSADAISFASLFCCFLNVLSILFCIDLAALTTPM